MERRFSKCEANYVLLDRSISTITKQINFYYTHRTRGAFPLVNPVRYISAFSALSIFFAFLALGFSNVINFRWIPFPSRNKLCFVPLRMNAQLKLACDGISFLFLASFHPAPCTDGDIHTAARRLCKCIAQSVGYVSQHRWSMTVGAMWKEFQAINDRQHYCSIDVRSRKTFTDLNLHERRITSWIIFVFGCWCWNDAVYDENKIVQTIRPMTDAYLTFFHFLSRANSQLPEERRTAAKHSPVHIFWRWNLNLNWFWTRYRVSEPSCGASLGTGFSGKFSFWNSVPVFQAWFEVVLDFFRIDVCYRCSTRWLKIFDRKFPQQIFKSRLHYKTAIPHQIIDRFTARRLPLKD